MFSKLNSCFLVLILCAPLCSSSAFTQEQPTLTDIERIWRERQNAVDTARLTWRYERTLSSDSVRQSISDSKDERFAAPKAQGLTLAADQCSFILAQERVRYESIGASFVSGEQGAAVPHLSAFDGQVQQYLNDRTRRPNQRSHGSLLSLNEFDEWGNVDLLPLVFALRPLRAEAFGPDPARWRVDQRPGVIDGRECVVIRSRPPDAPAEIQSTNTAYLDRERGFVPLRVTAANDGQVIIKLDMRYDRDGPYSWIPTDWTSTWFTRSGEMHNVSQVRQVEIVMLNEPVSDETFRITFPPGTVISDRRGKKKSDPMNLLIVQDNGSWKPLDPLAERKARIAAMQPWRLTPWVVGLGLCLLTVVGFVLWRRTT